MFRPAEGAASGDVPARHEPAARGNCSGPAVIAGLLVVSVGQPAVRAGHDVSAGHDPLSQSVGIRIADRHGCGTRVFTHTDMTVSCRRGIECVVCRHFLLACLLVRTFCSFRQTVETVLSPRLVRSFRIEHLFDCRSAQFV